MPPLVRPPLDLLVYGPATDPVPLLTAHRHTHRILVPRIFPPSESLAKLASRQIINCHQSILYLPLPVFTCPDKAYIATQRSNAPITYCLATCECDTNIASSKHGLICSPPSGCGIRSGHWGHEATSPASWPRCGRTVPGASTTRHARSQQANHGGQGQPPNSLQEDCPVCHSPRPDRRATQGSRLG